MKNKEYNNMINDPFLYNDCCGGGVMIAADGSQVPVTKQSPVITIATILLVIGIIGVGVFAYKKFVK